MILSASVFFVGTPCKQPPNSGNVSAAGEHKYRVFHGSRDGTA